MLPIGYFVFKEKIGWQAVAGMVLAIAGVQSCSSFGHILMKEILEGARKK